MKTIEKYVFGSFLSSFLLAFLVLSFVLTIALMVQIVGYILQGLPVDVVGRFALVSFPETMQWTIPLALLVSGVLVFSRLSADSEIAAMRACGVSILSVMKWPVAFGLLCSAFGLYINNEIAPRGHQVRRELKSRISVDTGLELLEAGRWISDFPKVKIFFAAKNGNWLEDLVVMDYSNPKVDRMITASRALVAADGEAIVLDLENMTVDPVDADHPQMARAERFRYRVDNALKKGVYRRKEKDFRFFEMLGAVREKEAELAAAERRFRTAARAGGDDASAAALKKALEAVRRSTSDIKTEFQRRFVFAMASICFVLVGIPLGIKSQRRESTIGMAVSLATAICYYLVMMLGMSLSRNYFAYPHLLVWIPVAGCAALAAWLVPKNL